MPPLAAVDAIDARLAPSTASAPHQQGEPEDDPAQEERPRRRAGVHVLGDPRPEKDARARLDRAER